MGLGSGLEMLRATAEYQEVGVDKRVEGWCQSAVARGTTDSCQGRGLRAQKSFKQGGEGISFAFREYSSQGQ